MSFGTVTHQSDHAQRGFYRHPGPQIDLPHAIERLLAYQQQAPNFAAAAEGLTVREVTGPSLDPGWAPTHTGGKWHGLTRIDLASEAWHGPPPSPYPTELDRTRLMAGAPPEPWVGYEYVLLANGDECSPPTAPEYPRRSSSRFCSSLVRSTPLVPKRPMPVPKSDRSSSRSRRHKEELGNRPVGSVSRYTALYLSGVHPVGSQAAGVEHNGHPHTCGRSG